MDLPTLEQREVPVLVVLLREAGHTPLELEPQVKVLLVVIRVQELVVLVVVVGLESLASQVRTTPGKLEMVEMVLPQMLQVPWSTAPEVAAEERRWTFLHHEVEERAVSEGALQVVTLTAKTATLQK